MNINEQKIAAKKFLKYWKDKGYERGESQTFWLSLLNKVYGIENPETYIEFEDKVSIDKTSFIDGYIPSKNILIEQKSSDKNLRSPILQSDGSKLTPFQQARRYSADLPYSKRPRWIITCNFKEFLVYDMENPNCEPEEILLENLETEYYRLNFLVDEKNTHLKKELEVSIKAGDIVGILYEKILEQYENIDIENTNINEKDIFKSLNILCVRLVFCLYAEDAGLFGKYGAFHDYLAQYDAKDLRNAIIKLFKILNQKEDERDPYEEDILLKFPYVNGGLFANDNIIIPQFNDEIKKLLLENASDNFDWSQISPTIFGAVFESTLNPETRRTGGMHYTSIENIHKVIDPLFLDELNYELEQIRNLEFKKRTSIKQQIEIKNIEIETFHNKLANLKFLDPACGSGNFLTETYLSIRRIENELIKIKIDLDLIEDKRIKSDSSQIRIVDTMKGLENPIRVSISQFNGIEINDFAVTVAKTALWIAESQMMEETSEILHMPIDFLPLKSYAHIIMGNAVSIDWNTVVSNTDLNYIMGNPPFNGARLMTKEQKSDMNLIFGKLKGLGDLDYVTAWYKKAAQYIDKTDIKVAFVSTNSISQGEQVGIIWKNLMEIEGIHIDFCYRTFIWNSEANIKAKVHCVIIGFSKSPSINNRIIYSDVTMHRAENINGYLLDAPNIFIEKRKKPLYNVPSIGIGNKPIDNGNYLFEKDEMEEFIKSEPKSAKYFKYWYGSKEFINKKPRYCLYIGECSPSELRKMPKVMERIKNVKEFRLASSSKPTQKLADTPTKFHVTNIPLDIFLVIPRVSSERRRYIPIGILNKDSLASDAIHIMQGAKLYHFGILISNVHMSWMRAVCGRLKSDYRYSKDIVYNNFPWPELTKENIKNIEKTAQNILDARNLYPDSSLADLYDETIMPIELREAHRLNDKVVMESYGFNLKMTESECVSELMKLYAKKTSITD